MSNALSLAQELQQTKATDVIRNERVRSQFINVYNSIWKEGGDVKQLTRLIKETDSIVDSFLRFAQQ